MPNDNHLQLDPSGSLEDAYKAYCAFLTPRGVVLPGQVYQVMRQHFLIGSNWMCAAFVHAMRTLQGDELVARLEELQKQAASFGSPPPDPVPEPSRLILPHS